MTPSALRRTLLTALVLAALARPAAAVAWFWLPAHIEIGAGASFKSPEPHFGDIVLRVQASVFGLGAYSGIGFERLRVFPEGQAPGRLTGAYLELGIQLHPCDLIPVKGPKDSKDVTLFRYFDLYFTFGMLIGGSSGDTRSEVRVAGTTGVGLTIPLLWEHKAPYLGVEYRYHFAERPLDAGGAHVMLFFLGYRYGT